MASDLQRLHSLATGEERLELETWPDHVALPGSFYGAPLCSRLDELDAQIAFLGIPFDLGTSFPGTRFAPQRIRETGGFPLAFPASVYSCSGPDGQMTAGGFYDITMDRQLLEGVTMADCGNVTIVPSDVERNFWRITRVVRQIVERGSLLVSVGGESSISAPVVRGFESYQRLDVVHFDAHVDFADHAQGLHWVNGSSIRRISELPWVRNITQIGMRMTRSREQVDAAHARGNRIITADRFREIGADAAIALVPESDAMYVTIDIDVMDPSICPGTGAPEPDGFTYREMRSALRALARRGRIVGIDLVEVAPPLDPSGLTSRTASKLLIEFLAAITDRS